MNKRIIILLGQPGVGKTTFGKRLQNEKIDHFSSGDALVANGALNRYRCCTTRDNMAELDRVAYELIDNKCKEFTENDVSVLILDCVKELAHGYNLISVLKKYELSNVIIMHLVRENITSIDTYQKRIKKWEKSKSSLLKLFSNYGILYNFTLWNDDDLALVKKSDFEHTNKDIYINCLIEGDSILINSERIKNIKLSDDEIKDRQITKLFILKKFDKTQGMLIPVKIYYKISHIDDYRYRTYLLYNNDITQEIINFNTIFCINHEDIPIGEDKRIITYFKNESNEYYNIIAQFQNTFLDLNDNDFSKLQSDYFNLEKIEYDTPANMIFDMNIIQEIDDTIKKILHVSRIEVSLPSSFLDYGNDHQINWLIQPNRYYVSRKCDGIRYLLIKLEDKTYLRDRSGSIYSCNIYNSLESNTILDGELVKMDGKEIYFVFDVLGYKNNKTWHMPLEHRISIITYGIAVPSDKEKPSKILSLQESSDKIILVDKRYFPVDCNSLEELTKKTWYATDGLIFTPGTYYSFGKNDLLFKWQPFSKISIDVKYNGEIFEESLNLLEGQWELSNKKRWDKSTENHPSIRQNYLKILSEKKRLIYFSEKRGFAINCLSLVGSLDDIQNLNTGKAIENIYDKKEFQIFVQNKLDRLSLIKQFAIRSSNLNYLEYKECKRIDFHIGFMTYFIKHIKDLVQENFIEENIDAITQLSIFNYRKGCKNIDKIKPYLICRGLVIHVPTKRLVAIPMKGFCGYKHSDNILSNNDNVQATLKMDGSLIIVFIWEGRLHVTTRRRMNSEQALWAKDWLINNVDIDLFKPNHTYMFECIYKNNRVVINYCFDGLILLTVNKFNPNPNYCYDFIEFTYEERLNLALDLGVPTMYQFIGLVQSFIDFKPTFLINEGWVIRSNNGRRVKIVTDEYKKCSDITEEIHPLNIWKIIYRRHLNEFIEKLPHYLYDELNTMVDAFKVRYEKTRIRLKTDIERSTKPLYNNKYKTLLNNVLSQISEDININSLFENIIFDNFKICKISKIECTKLCVFKWNQEKERYISECNCEYRNQIFLYNAISQNKIYNYILRYIKPTNKEKYYIPYYEPSQNFKQTFCKNWEKHEERFDYKYGDQPFDKLNEDTISQILSNLDIHTLLECSKTCIWMDDHITVVFKDKILQYKETLKNIIKEDKEDKEEEYNISMEGGYSS